MTKIKTIALILCMGLVGSITYSIQTNAETSDEVEYASEGESTLENETQSEESTIDLDELTTQSYVDYSTDFVEKLVIVGDSIASGFKSYERLPEGQVLATGSIGARNIHSFKVTLDGEELDILDALTIKQPQYIFMSMGMNDVNMISSDEYITNYTQNINDILQICPNSTIIVMGITPVTIASGFCDNSKIDEYNDALKDMATSLRGESKDVYYINVSKYLKDEDSNSLKSEYSSGDGIHLSGTAYDYIFTTMMQTIAWI